MPIDFNIFYLVFYVISCIEKPKKFINKYDNI